MSPYSAILISSLSSTSLVLSQTFTRQNTHYWSPNVLNSVLSSVGNLCLNREKGRKNMELQKVGKDLTVVLSIK